MIKEFLGFTLVIMGMYWEHPNMYSFLRSQHCQLFFVMPTVRVVKCDRS